MGMFTAFAYRMAKKISSLFPAWPIFPTNVQVLEEINNWSSSGTFTVELIGTTYAGDDAKWGHGVIAPNGKIYFAPLTRTSVLVVDPSTDTTTTIGSVSTSGGASWVGCVLATDGKIYCAPGTKNTVLIINPMNDTVSESADLGTLSGAFFGTQLRYNGAILAQNGDIYCIPFAATAVLRITPGVTPSYNAFGSFGFGDKWASGVILDNGVIYCMPCNTASILKINTTNNTLSTFGNITGGYKYVASMLGSNGKIYSTPHYGATRTLVIDPSNDSTSLFGTTFQINVEKFSSMQVGQDGWIYSCPAGGLNTNIQFYGFNPQDSSERFINYASVAGRYFAGMANGRNGAIYCSPETIPTQVAKLTIPGNGSTRQAWNDIIQSPNLNKG